MGISLAFGIWRLGFPLPTGPGKQRMTMSAKISNPIQSPELPSLCLAMTEHSPLPIATVEGATHIVRYANAAFCHLMRKPAEDLVGHPLSELLPAKDTCVSLLDRVYRSKKPESHL